MPEAGAGKLVELLMPLLNPPKRSEVSAHSVQATVVATCGPSWFFAFEIVFSPGMAGMG